MSVFAAVLCALLQAQDPKPEPKAEAPKTDEMPLEVYWKDRLWFRTKDGAFQGNIGGRLLTHYRAVFDRPDDNVAADGLRTVPDGFFIRQARLETEGTFAKEFGYKVQVDFATGQFNQSSGAGPSNVSGTLRDGFVEWKRHPEFQVRLGQFFEPISQEDIQSTRFIDFAERSVINRLLPGREIGLQFAGALFDKQFDYAVMLNNGGALLNDQGRAVTDSNDEKEVAALLRVSPFLKSESEFLKGLRLGVGGSIGEADGIAATGFDLISTELSVMWLDSTGRTLDGRRWRVVPQISWPIGPFALRAEYLLREDELLEAANPEDELQSSGFYVSGTLLVTGEDKKVEDRVVPKGEWGALEVAIRFAQLEIDDPFDAGVATAPGNADKVSSITAGVNWWIRRNVRVTANFIHEKYSDDLQFDNRMEDTLTGVIFRGQIDF